MKAKLVRIGNSRGVRIPAAIIEQCGFGDQVELTVEGRTLVVAPTRKPREGWDEAFEAAAAEAAEDELLWPDDMTTEFDEKEWTW